MVMGPLAHSRLKVLLGFSWVFALVGEGFRVTVCPLWMTQER